MSPITHVSFSYLYYQVFFSRNVVHLVVFASHSIYIYLYITLTARVTILVVFINVLCVFLQTVGHCELFTMQICVYMIVFLFLWC